MNKEKVIKFTDLCKILGRAPRGVKMIINKDPKKFGLDNRIGKKIKGIDPPAVLNRAGSEEVAIHYWGSAGDFAQKFNEAFEKSNAFHYTPETEVYDMPFTDITTPVEPVREGLVQLKPNSENGQLTMSTMEIAKLVEKRHDNVMRDCREMLEDLKNEIGFNDLKFEGVYVDAKGEERPCYNLPEDLVLTLILKYSTVARHRVVKEWTELKKQKGLLEPPKMKSRAEWMLQQALTAVEHEHKLLAHDEKLKDQGERIEVVEARQDSIEAKKDFFTIVAYFKLKDAPLDNETARTLGMKAARLSRARGVETPKVQHEQYGYIKMYHIDICKEVFQGWLQEEH